MILLADSGSTKTDWALIDEGSADVIRVTTMGYNPYFIDSSGISQSLATELLPYINPLSVTRIYFYGAGCSTPEKHLVIKEALGPLFTNVTAIFAGHDLLASARALLGHSSGFAAILGTGTNSCLYDGNECTHNIDSLGYMLGDEGSGSYIGRMLLRDFMRKLMPEDLSVLFKSTFNLESNQQIITDLYKHPFPNRQLASFTRFTEGRTDHPYVQQLAKQAFTDFFKQLVSHYPQYQSYSFNCVGSIGYNFAPILSEVASAFGMQTGKIIQSPMEDLIAYHRSL